MEHYLSGHPMFLSDDRVDEMLEKLGERTTVIVETRHYDENLKIRVERLCPTDGLTSFYYECYEDKHNFDLDIFCVKALRMLDEEDMRRLRKSLDDNS